MIKKILSLTYKAKGFLQIVTVLVLIKSFLLDISIVPTSSMSPTILPGDIVVSTKYNYGYSSYSISPIAFGSARKKIFNKTPKQGDVIIFKVNRNDAMVKRVVGLPGQKIQMIQGVLFIDDVAMEKKFEKITTDNEHNKCAVYKEQLGDIQHCILEKANLLEEEFESTQNWGPFNVPKKQYFCLGDYRHNSKDSRYIGCIPQEQIVAKAKLILFSLKSFQNIHSYKRSLSKI